MLFIGDLQSNLKVRFRFEDIDILSRVAGLFSCNTVLGDSHQGNLKVVAKYYDMKSEEPLGQYKMLQPSIDARAANFRLVYDGKNSYGTCCHLVHFHCGGDNMNEIKTVMSAFVTCPISTTDCERAFSVMKLIKAEQRNALFINLSSCMVVALESPSIEDYDFKTAVIYSG